MPANLLPVRLAQFTPTLLLCLLLGCSGETPPSEKQPTTRNADDQRLAAAVKQPLALEVVPPKEDQARPVATKIVLEKLPPVTTDNKNDLVKRYRNLLQLTASSTWNGWPPSNALDDNIKSSWFSGKDDSAAKGKRPWLQVNFPVAVPVRRVTVLGNRDPQWLVGFTILEGSVTLYDRNGQVLKYVQNKGTGNFRDFDYHFNPAVAGVSGVRFTSHADQGSDTQFGDIAIAEIQVE